MACLHRRDGAAGEEARGSANSGRRRIAGRSWADLSRWTGSQAAGY